MLRVRREDLGAVVGEGHGVLEVRGAGAVGGHDGPAVVEEPGRALARVDHRLDRQHHARPQPHPAPGRLRSWAPRALRASRCRCRGRRTPAPRRSPPPRRHPPPRRRCRRAGCRPRPAAIAASSDALVVSIRRCDSASIVADRDVMAASACQPSMMAPQSIETMSPSSSTRSSGMPCTITSLGEMQATAGKPW